MVVSVPRIRRILLNLGIVAVAAAALAACSSARETFGLARQSPDEFAVVTRAPLKLPPDYRLRAPRPGAVRPQEGTTTDSAKAILLGSVDRTSANGAGAGTTQGESAILSRAGTANADPAIREKVNREAAVLAEDDRGLVGKILFWQKPQPVGQIVDASRESKRIQENIALGDSVTKGAVPVIERRERGWLEGIF